MNDVSQHFLLEVLGKGLVAKYRPDVSKPSTYFGMIYGRIGRRMAEKAFPPRRADLEPSALGCAAGRSPLELVADRELIEIAQERYRQLALNQQLALVKIYPFLGGAEGGSTTALKTEYVDRQRGLAAIQAAVRDRCG